MHKELLQKQHIVSTEGASTTAFYFSQPWCVIVVLYTYHTLLVIFKLNVYILKTFKYVNIYLNGKWPTTSTSAIHKANILICYSQES